MPPHCSPEARTILVVDDEPALREFAQALLLDIGYAAVLAGSGDAAVQIMLQNPTAAAAVLLDMNMPGMKPEETVRRLRELCANLPIIIVSGDSEALISTRFAPGTLAGYVEKPYTEVELDAALTKAWAPQAPKSRPTFKLERLSELDNQELAQEFLATRTREVPRMAELLEAGDFERLRLMSHSLKGSGGCFGFSELSRLGGALERYAQASNAASCAEHLALLKDYLESLSPNAFPP